MCAVTTVVLICDICTKAMKYWPSMLNTRHNLHYYIDLMAQARNAIEQDRFGAFRKEFYQARNVEAASV